MTERSITPDEAYGAVLSIAAEVGCELERLHEYDPKKDRFTVEARRHADKKLIQLVIFGETVARVVKTARTIAGRGDKHLVRPSDLVRPA